MQEIMKKYPRTRHLQGSRLQAGDEDLDQAPFESLRGRHIVVEEKVDGANTGISFSRDGKLLLQSRGHFLTGGPREAHFSLFKQWGATHADDFREVLTDRYVLYGEWLYAKHTVFYDQLPHYFLEYDVLDKETGEWLDTPRRRELLQLLPVVGVPVLFEGLPTTLDDLLALIGPSHFISANIREALRESCSEAGYEFERALPESELSGRMEGLYIKIEEDGVIRERLKWVRHDFLQAMLISGSHWQDRPVIPNRLRDGVNIWTA